MVLRLLENTGSYGVKRMFLYMAEKAGHYWLDELNPSRIELGTSKLQLVPGGVYISKYKITIPQSLNSYEVCTLGDATVKIEVNATKRGIIGDVVELPL